MKKEHSLNSHNLDVMHLGCCTVCGGTKIEQNVSAAQFPSHPIEGEAVETWVWIRASERLPELREDIFFKFTDPDGYIYKHAGQLVNYQVSELTFFKSDNGSGYGKSQFENIEWLSRRTAPTVSDAVEGNEWKTKSERLDKELDITHACITELYELDGAAKIIRKHLDKIDKL